MNIITLAANTGAALVEVELALDAFTQKPSRGTSRKVTEACRKLTCAAQALQTKVEHMIPLET